MEMEMEMAFKKTKDSDRKGAEYRITIGSYFQDLTQEEAEALFEKMCDNLESRCRLTNDESDKPREA